MPMRSCRLIRRANRGPSSTSAPAGGVRLPALAPGCARRGQSSRDEQCRVFSQTAAALLSLKLDNAGRTLGRGRSERAESEALFTWQPSYVRPAVRPSFRSVRLRPTRPSSIFELNKAIAQLPPPPIYLHFASDVSADPSQFSRLCRALRFASGRVTTLLMALGLPCDGLSDLLTSLLLH